jgi:hypothetical protein
MSRNWASVRPFGIIQLTLRRGISVGEMNYAYEAIDKQYTIR